MSNVIIDRQKIDILANAISTKSGVPLTMTLDEMVEAVDGIQAGGNTTLITKSITVNGTYNASSDNANGYSSVTVNVPSGSPTLQTKAKTYTPTTSQQTESVSADSGYDGLSAVNVTVNAMPTGSLIAASNYSISNPTIEVGETGLIVVTGESQQIVNPVYTSGYIDTFATQYITVGVYGTYQQPTGTQGTPTATKGTVSNHSVSVTPSVTNTTGYITGSTKTGTAVTVSASELVSGTYNITSSGTKDVTNYASASVPAGSVTAPSSISGTAASVSTGTNTLTLTKTVSVTPNVTTAGYISSGTAGNSSVSLTASVTTKAAATITPTTTNQTIAAGTYLTGAQTIAGDADLVASNIVSGVQIFGVTGNVVLQNYYTGSSAPSSSTGSNGDLYLQT